MPAPLVSLPSACPAIPATAAQASAADSSARPTSASFDQVFNKATPPASPKSPASSAKSGQPASTDSKKPATSTSDAADESEEATADKSLTPEQLAALLALMGNPAVPQQPTPVALNLDASHLADATDSSELSSETPFGDLRPATPAQLPGSAKESFVLPQEDSAAENAASTAREALAQGVETLDYALAETPDSALPAGFKLVTPTPVSSGETPATETTQSDEKQPGASAEVTAQAPEVLEQVATQTASATAADRAQAPSTKSSRKGPAEKNAGSGDFTPTTLSSRVRTSISASENKFLNADEQSIVKEQRFVGTGAANWGDSMKSHSQNTPDAGAAMKLGAAVATGTRNEIFTPASEQSTATQPAQAASIVREIRDIADGMWAVERNSVEVRFNFSETERLSVRIEYKNGVVQTTFRTHSPELRDTIAREWQSQIASSEARPYRVADPVFNTPPADARGFSLGGDASRQQQRQAEQSASGPATFAASFNRGVASGSSSTAPASTPALVRPDTALHLHAFA